MDLSSDELLQAYVASIDRLKTAIRPAELAYLLLTGTCENTLRDLLACELFARGFLPARDCEHRGTGKRMLIDIALLERAARRGGKNGEPRVEWGVHGPCP